MVDALILREVIVSKYDNAFSKEANQVFLENELLKIKDGTYKLIIEACRRSLQEKGKSKYDELKKQLAAITFCGTFNGAHKKENLIKFNSILVLDIDNLLDEEVEAKKALLFQDEHIFACWISPSGRGIKCLLKTSATAELHKFYFDASVRYFEEKYNVNLDKSGSDICRLCFVSHDPNLLLKEQSKIFDIDIDSALQEAMSEAECATGKAKPNKEFLSKMLYSEKVLFYRTEERNKSNDRELLSKLIKYLTKKKCSITSTYSDWYRVALAIANTFTIDIGEKYFLQLCRLDGGNHDEYKSRLLLDYCYRNRRVEAVNFATIIFLAQKEGFQLKSSAKPFKS